MFSTSLQARRIAVHRGVILILVLLLLIVPAAVSRADDHPVPSTVQEVQVSSDGANSSVGMVSSGYFLVAWQTADYLIGNHWVSDIRVQRYYPDGWPLNEEGKDGVLTAQSPNLGAHEFPSAAASQGGNVRVGWEGQGCPVLGGLPASTLLWTDFDFGQFIISPVDVNIGNKDRAPSVGVSESTTAGVTWGRTMAYTGQPVGLIWTIGGPGGAEGIRGCEPWTCGDRLGQYRPCMAMRADGYFAVAYAYDEWAEEQSPPFNVAVEVYSSDGSLVAYRHGPDINSATQWVNNPSVEDADPEDDTTQTSPAVSFAGNDIVVSWIGPRISGCTDAYHHVYARRFKFDDLTNPGTPELRDPIPVLQEGRPGMFIVDSVESSVASLSVEQARPTVALISPSDQPGGSPWDGAFVIAWTAMLNDSWSSREVHAQYFDPYGRPMGQEFRVNQADGTDHYARLARSGQHTVAFGQDLQAVVTWTEGYDPAGVYATVLPPAHWETTTPAWPCYQPGDVNGDCFVDGLDIQPFIDLVLASDQMCRSAMEIARADINMDGFVDVNDVAPFTGLLLGVQNGLLVGDCNGNDIADASDIASGRSLDCNNNFIPDECDIASNTSNDLNLNGVPDECEPDCNGNGVPDDKDIADETSNDVNGNGIPDECEIDCNHNGVPDDWDILQETSADCNANGRPDECDPDCNHNNVPDDCDIANETSLDCNGNGVPDECELNWAPPRGSLDCNDNGIPDECDIANCPENDPSCQDCNGNGFPDGCDIAAEISLDENENGIPDECEGGENSLLGGGYGENSVGGNGLDGDGPGELAARLEALEEFHDWCQAQGWGPNAATTGAEQFQAMTAKLQELGLPVQNRKSTR